MASPRPRLPVRIHKIGKVPALVIGITRVVRARAVPPDTPLDAANMSGSMTMARLSEMLELSMGRPLLDETGVQGTFDIHWQAESPSLEDVTAVLGAQLELALTPAERDITFLVVKPA